MNIFPFPSPDTLLQPYEELEEKFVCKISFTQAQKLKSFDAINVRDPDSYLPFRYMVPDELIEKGLKERGVLLKRFTFIADIELLIAEPTFLEKLWYHLKIKLRRFSIFQNL